MRIDKDTWRNVLLAVLILVVGYGIVANTRQAVVDLETRGYQVRTIGGILSGVTLPVTGTTIITTTEDIPVTLDNEVVSSQPFTALAETGVTELIGADEQASQYDYSEGTEIALGGSYSGEILNVTLILSGTLSEAGTLLIFDADPSVTLADANLATASWLLAIGKIDVAAGNWFEENSGGTGAVATFAEPIAFHSLSSLWVAYYHEGSTQWNSLAADNETLDIQVEYRRDS